jgi:hypothetical protein
MDASTAALEINPEVYPPDISQMTTASRAHYAKVQVHWKFATDQREQIIFSPRDILSSTFGVVRRFK